MLYAVHGMLHRAWQSAVNMHMTATVAGDAMFYMPPLTSKKETSSE